MYLGCFLNLVAGEPEVVFGHFYPADPNAGGRIGRGGCNDVLEQGVITLVSLYRKRALREHVNAINFMFLFNMAFVSPRLLEKFETHLC